ncbi:hypothetical protein BT96DRAFT_1006103 [Gymnopus androsaceus JB14]|uniref:Uncharacterized protein n=1 Tax=Gymnopus androsaceus JB14 TaxID=1447944 RepID=A0A6A4GLU1_9AGAR|nr:hypothetical protein BT96DRAFT_1006103 [Gymnopus androsaceus JB14]
MVLDETAQQLLSEMSIPANLDNAQSQATKGTDQVAGLDVLRVINEPTATALAYGLGKADSAVISIYDFDISIFSLLVISSGTAEKAKIKLSFTSQTEINLPFLTAMLTLLIPGVLHCCRLDPQAEHELIRDNKLLGNFNLVVSPGRSAGYHRHFLYVQRHCLRYQLHNDINRVDMYNCLP